MTGHATKAERKGDRELVVSRVIRGPARLVFEAWAKPELFQRWWVPISAPIELVSCAWDVRTGGKYRLVFDFQGQEVAFFGSFLEVTPPTRIVWTNEEGGAEAGAISTASFEDRGDGTTLVTMHDVYPSKEALEAAIASGSTEGAPEQLAQLDALVVSLA